MVEKSEHQMNQKSDKTKKGDNKCEKDEMVKKSEDQMKQKSDETNKIYNSCEIFGLTYIEYENSILNYPEIISQAIKQYSYSDILNLSIKLDEN